MSVAPTTSTRTRPSRLGIADGALRRTVFGGNYPDSWGDGVKNTFQATLSGALDHGREGENAPTSFIQPVAVGAGTRPWPWDSKASAGSLSSGGGPRARGTATLPRTESGPAASALRAPCDLGTEERGQAGRRPPVLAPDRKELWHAVAHPGPWSCCTHPGHPVAPQRGALSRPRQGSGTSSLSCRVLHARPRARRSLRTPAAVFLSAYSFNKNWILDGAGKPWGRDRK